MMLSAADFGRLEQLLKCSKDNSWGEKYDTGTGSRVVHAIRKQETFLLLSQDNPMYIISFKKAFG